MKGQEPIVGNILQASSPSLPRVLPENLTSIAPKAQKDSLQFLMIPFRKKFILALGIAAVALTVIKTNQKATDPNLSDPQAPQNLHSPLTLNPTHSFSYGALLPHFPNSSPEDLLVRGKMGQELE